MKQRSLSAFSLIELTLAIGIAAFCLLAVMGLIPIAVQTNRNATSQTAATNIIASVIADMRATTARYIPAIWHHVRHCENIVLRQRRTVYDIVRCEFAISREGNVSNQSNRPKLC